MEILVKKTIRKAKSDNNICEFCKKNIGKDEEYRVLTFYNRSWKEKKYHINCEYAMNHWETEENKNTIEFTI